MHQKQKEKAFAILKERDTNRNYLTEYWIPYKDYLDPTDRFTNFSCDNLEEIQGYLDLIENLLRADNTAKVYVSLYGCEEYNNERHIDAETLILFSRLSLSEIKQIFNEPEDNFPSDIGEESVFSRPTFIIDENGDLAPVASLPIDGYSIYYCWWD